MYLKNTCQCGKPKKRSSVQCVSCYKSYKKNNPRHRALLPCKHLYKTGFYWQVKVDRGFKGVWLCFDCSEAHIRLATFESSPNALTYVVE